MGATILCMESESAKQDSPTTDPSTHDGSSNLSFGEKFSVVSNMQISVMQSTQE